MKLVLSFFIVLNLILGILFIKIKVSAKKIDIVFIRKNIKTANYDINIGVYFLGFIKICNISIKNGYVKFLFIKKSIDEINNSKVFLKNIKLKFIKTSPKKMLENFKKIRFKLENLNLDLEVGTESVLFTSVLIGLLSTIISSSMQSYIEKFNKEKYKWKILPNFEERVLLNLNASLNLSYSPVLNIILKNV